VTRRIRIGPNWRIAKPEGDDRERLIVSRHVPEFERIRQRKSKKMRPVKRSPK